MARSHSHRLGGGIVVLLPDEVPIFGRHIEQAYYDVEAVLGPEFFENAPFEDVSVVVVIGERTCLKPEYERIVKVHGARELPISVALDIEALKYAPPDVVGGIFRQALLDALLAVGVKYRLPVEPLREARQRQPTLIEETEAQPACTPTDQVSAQVDEEGTDEGLTLYRHSSGQASYWETWEDEDSIIVHSGVLGDTGQTTELPLSAASRRRVRAEAKQRRAEGYAPVSDEDLATVLLQYQLDTWGDADDLDRRHEIENLMDECLGWTGLGHCDGGDIGSGTANVCCLVIDPDVAIRVMVAELEGKGYLAGATIAIETDEGFAVRWPTNYQGKFSY